MNPSKEVTHLPWNPNQTETVIILGRTKERSCDGKGQYRTRKFAYHVTDKIFTERRERLEVYFCPYCKFFHIGHPVGFNHHK